MTRSSPPQLSFSAGEISPLLAARQDYQRFQTGLSVCRGFIPLRQGGVTRAPGTWYRGRTAGDDKARLIGFQFARDDAVVLEFTHQLMRVWRYGQLVMSGGTPYQLATPYREADLPNLQWVQSADVIYFADGAHPIQKLSRYDLDNWTISPAAFETGPFRAPNGDVGKTITASAATGTITLTGAGNPFSNDMVGSLMLLEPIDMSSVPLWAGNESVSANYIARFDSRIYQLTAGTNTGVNPPTHLEGTQAYGGGATWKYLSDTMGIVRITAVDNGNSASATVLRDLPAPLVTEPTWRWSLSAWSSKHGYPAALEIYEQRLVAAATPTDPRTVWFSGAGLYDDFLPSVEADGAFAYSIAGRQSLNRIIWLAAGQRALHIGALGEEHSSRSVTPGVAIGPTTAVFGFDSAYGSIAARPIAPDGRPIFISRDGRRVIEMAYSFQTDAVEPRELSLPSEHIGQGGFAEAVWQSAPLRLAWFRHENGELAVMVHDPTEDVLGWARYPLAGGQVESMVVTASADGNSDTLTLVVEREIDGVTARCIEEQAVIYGTVAGDDPIHDANHLFCATQMTSAQPFSQVSAPHLAGEKVTVWTDTGQFGPLVLDTNGNADLGHPVSSAIIGMADESQSVCTLDLPAPTRDGSAMGRKKRLHATTGIYLHRSAGGRARARSWSFARTPRAHGWHDLVRVPVGTDADTAWSGAQQLELVSDAATGCAIEIVPDGAKPLTILALVPRIEECGS